MGKVVKSVTKAIGSVAKGATDVVKGVVQPIYNATLKNIPGIDSALVNLDKSVGKAIPGGWGTIAAVASSFIPGAQLAAMGMTKTGLATGLGALSGSGVLKKGNEFNLQGALMGGATAYGLSTLGEYARAAANPSAVTPTVDASGAMSGSSGSAFSPQQLSSLTSGDTGILNQLSAGMEGGAGAGLQAAPDVISGAIPNLSGSLANSAPIPGSIAAQNAYELQGLQEGYQSAFREPSMFDKIGTSISEVPKDVGNFLDKATTGSTYEGLGGKSLDTLKGMGSEMADTGAGIKNLLTNAPGASAAAATTGISPLTSAGAAIMGGTGLMALEEQKAYLNEQLAAGRIAQAEYDAQVAEIDRQVAVARKATADNPFSYTPDRSVGDLGSTIYGKTGATDTLYAQNYDPSQTLYARGGEVQHYAFGGRAFMDRLKSIPDDLADKLFPQRVAARQAAAEAAAQAAVDKQIAATPYNINPDRSVPNLGPTDYQKQDREFTLYQKNAPTSGSRKESIFAAGGSIDDNIGMDEYMGIPQGNMQRGFMGGGIAGYAAGGYADGGSPRFLSGGGDGMSDSIRATIGGTQEARLADGEFVIPADVVSHLGNGSSKAGAKQLYSMMDKVRRARTGNPKQGKKINPRKYLAA
jgi:hypothetical protein